MVSTENFVGFFGQRANRHLSTWLRHPRRVVSSACIDEFRKIRCYEVVAYAIPLKKELVVGESGMAAHVLADRADDSLQSRPGCIVESECGHLRECRDAVA